MVILRIVSLFVLLGVTTLTSGCIPVAVTAGAAAGIAASKEGGVGGELEDARINAAINDAWFRYDVKMFSKLNLAVEQGNVLITGVVQNPEDRVEAIRMAWQVRGVKKVINEVQVAEGEGVSGYLKDTWIGTQLRARLTASRDVSALNYTIEVVRGVVYLMGVARSQSELNEVVDIARNIDYVQNVVSYVRVEVPQAPVITGSTASNAPASSNTITAYPSGSPQNKGMAPIIDDPYAGNAPTSAPSGGVLREELPSR